MYIYPQGESKCALVYGQMNEPPGARARVGLTGLTVAEHFRDAEGQDVLLFIDNIFRFTQVSYLFRYLNSILLFQLLKLGEMISDSLPLLSGTSLGQL